MRRVPEARRPAPPLASAPAGAAREQLERIDSHPRRDPLDRSQRQVALAALDTAHVGAMHAEQIGEVFLAQTAGFTALAHAPPDRGLQFAFHAGKPHGRAT